MDEQSSLLALFTSSFLAATLLPGGSEAVLFGVLKAYPQLYWTALAVASVGNTLGGMSSYAIGRFLPDEKALMQKSKGNMRGLGVGAQTRQSDTAAVLGAADRRFAMCRCGMASRQLDLRVGVHGSRKVHALLGHRGGDESLAAYPCGPMMPGTGRPMPGSSARPLGSTLTPHET